MLNESKLYKMSKFSKVSHLIKPVASSWLNFPCNQETSSDIFNQISVSLKLPTTLSSNHSMTVAIVFILCTS